jgi:predicted PurR-regulated permease PerM
VTFTRGSSPLVPSWLDHLSAIGWRVLVTVGLGLAVVALCVVLSTTVLSLLLGFILSATLAPYATALRARGWSGLKAAGAITGALVLGVVVILALVFVALAPYVRDIAAVVSAAATKLSDALAELPNGSQIASLFDTVVGLVTSWLSSQLSTVASTIATIATIGMLGLFMTFFLLADGDKAWSLSVSGISQWRRERLEAAGRRAVAQAGGYLRGTAISAVIKAGTDFVFLLVLGVPFAGPLALLVLFGAFVPYVGAFLTTSIMLLVAYGSGGTGTALILFALIVGVYALLGNASSRIFKQTVELHPAIVLVALPIGAAFAGVLGMVLAVPTVGFLAAIVDPLLEVLGERRDDPAADRDNVPLWLDRLAQWSWRLLVGAGLLLLVVLALARVPLVIGPIVVGITLAATFLPALARLQARGLSRFWASTVIMVLLWAGIIIVTILSLAALAGSATDLGSTPDAITTTPDPGPTPQAAIKAIVEVFTNGLIGTIVVVLRELIGAAFFLVLTALLSFFFLEAGDRAWDKITSRLSGWRRREVEQAGSKGASILGGYILATGVLGAFNAITGFIIMVVLGLPLALPIAVLSFLGGFIPYIGQALTSLLAFFVALKFGSTQDVLIMGVYTIIMNVAQGSFIAPLVYGRAVSIHPAIVLMAIPAGGELAGVLGMFLAVPVVGVFAATWRNVLTALGSEPAETDLDTTPDTASAAPAAPPGVPVAQPEA